MRISQLGRAAALVIVGGTLIAYGTTSNAAAVRWKVIRSTDPITGVSSCIVAAPDQVDSFNFTRSFMLYPIVEKNSQRGLLVGVSSGGRVRVPVGEILWRVDDKPFREIGANMMEMASGMASSTNSTAELMRLQQEMIAAATATSTVAKGDEAVAMLQEMRAGRTLLFRQKQAAPSYGLPGEGGLAVGQYSSKGGHEPIPLDNSFLAGLKQCGIDE